MDTKLKEICNEVYEEVIAHCKRECEKLNYSEIMEFFGNDFSEVCYSHTTDNDISDQLIEQIYKESMSEIDRCIERLDLAEGDNEIRLGISEYLMQQVQDREGEINGIILGEFRDRVLQDGHTKVAKYIDKERYSEHFSEIQDEDLQESIPVVAKQIFYDALQKSIPMKSQSVKTKLKI